MSQNGRRNVRRVVHDAYYDEYRRDASFELIFEVLLRIEIIKWPTKNVCFSCLGLLIALKYRRLTGSHNLCFEMLRVDQRFTSYRERRYCETEDSCKWHIYHIHS